MRPHAEPPRRRSTGDRLAGDRGAVIVESALIMPLLFVFIFGMIDFGFATFSTAQAAGAARDGARRAVLWPDDPTGIYSTSMTASVRAAAVAHLDQPGKVTGFEVYCLEGSTGTTRVACGIAEPGTDRVTTSVSWTYKPMTFMGDLFPFRTITGTSTMVMVGKPMAELASTPTSSSTMGTTTSTAPTTTTSGSDPTTTTQAPTTSTTAAPTTTSTLAPVTTVAECMANVEFKPTHGKLAGGSVVLNGDVKATVTINGSGSCSGPQLRYFVDTGSGATKSAVVSMSATSTARTYTAVIPAQAPNGWSWEAGSHLIEVIIGGSGIQTTPAALNVI